MKQKFDFLKTTLLGGIVFLLPLALLGMVIGKVIEVMNLFANVVEQWIPIDSFLHIVIINLAALLIVIILFFFAGLATKSLLGKRLLRFIETKLSILPGYAIFKARLTGNLGSEVEKQSLKPVIINLKDHSIIGFQVEQVDADRVMAFVPAAPDPWTGTMIVIEKKQLTDIDLEPLEVMNVFENLGKGAKRCFLA
ncbi:MAG: DUF502 domain-containing protein [Chlamydiota bacterium]